jgi:protein SCO1/2
MRNVCPLATENLARVQATLGDRVDKDIRFVSISLQPEHDTPEVMKAFTEKHGVGLGWLFLTGQKDDVELLRHRLGFVDIDPVVEARSSISAPCVSPTSRCIAGP